MCFNLPFEKLINGGSDYNLITITILTLTNKSQSQLKVQNACGIAGW